MADSTHEGPFDAFWLRCSLRNSLKRIEKLILEFIKLFNGFIKLFNGIGAGTCSWTVSI